MAGRSTGGPVELDFSGMEKMAEIIAKAQAKAFADGAASARATIDALNGTIKTLQDALESREKKIQHGDEQEKKLLGELGDLVKTNSELAVAQSKERIAKMQLEAETGWRKELLSSAGPQVIPALGTLLKKWAGVDLSAGDEKLLKGDGTAEGDGRAALFQVVMFIGSRSDLVGEIARGVGKETWSKAMDFLMAQQQAAAALPESKANGTAS